MEDLKLDVIPTPREKMPWAVLLYTDQREVMRVPAPTEERALQTLEQMKKSYLSSEGDDADRT